MWQLTSDDGTKRVYTNTTTGNRLTQTRVFINPDGTNKDWDGNSWWQFDDLHNMTTARNFATTKVTSLFALNLTVLDLDEYFEAQKKTLKSDDAEKYEKAYAALLNFEAKARDATSPIKQLIGLVCVYFTLNDEYIDSFQHDIQIKKFSILELNQEAQSFFLSRQRVLIEHSMARSNLYSQIVLPKQENVS